MKINQCFLLLSAIVIFAVESYPEETICPAGYSLKRNATYVLLSITIELNNDVAGGKISGNFEENEKKPFGVNTDSVKSQVLMQINRRNDMQVYYELPEYLNKILEFIPDTSNRKKAVELYKDNNRNTLIKAESSNSVTIVNNTMKEEVKVTLSVPVVVKKSVTFTLKPLKFTFNGRMLKTNALKIKIEV